MQELLTNLENHGLALVLIAFGLAGIWLVGRGVYKKVMADNGWGERLITSIVAFFNTAKENSDRSMMLLERQQEVCKIHATTMSDTNSRYRHTTIAALKACEAVKHAVAELDLPGSINEKVEIVQIELEKALENSDIREAKEEMSRQHYHQEIPE